MADIYKPVSLTCICCKFMEYKHIIRLLEKHNILTLLQHWFRIGYLCETQLILTLQDVMQYRDNKNQVDIAILDFSKAFDTVPHNKLLYKLKHNGINGNTLKTKKSISSSGWETLLMDRSWLWSSTQKSIWTNIIHYTHTWPPKISLTTCKTIGRWLPAIQSNQISSRPNQFPINQDKLQIWTDK